MSNHDQFQGLAAYLRAEAKSVAWHQPNAKTLSDWADAVDRTEAAAMAATVPAGWKLVPVNPTVAQKEAGARLGIGYDLAHECYRQMLLAAPQAPVADQPAEPSPADMLDWLDETNKRFKMGWEVGAAPAGNVSVRTIIMGGKPIREAIRAAMPAPKGDSNG